MKVQLLLGVLFVVFLNLSCIKAVKYSWSLSHPFTLVAEEPHHHHHDDHHHHDHGHHHHDKGHGHHASHSHGHGPPHPHKHHHHHKGPPPPVHVHIAHKKPKVIHREHIHKEHVHVHHIHRHNYITHNHHKYNHHKHNQHIINAPEQIVHNYHKEEVKLVPSSHSVKKVIPIHHSQHQVFTTEEKTPAVVVNHEAKVQPAAFSGWVQDTGIGWGEY